MKTMFQTFASLVAVLAASDEVTSSDMKICSTLIDIAARGGRFIDCVEPMLDLAFAPHRSMTGPVHDAIRAAAGVVFMMQEAHAPRRDLNKTANMILLQAVMSDGNRIKATKMALEAIDLDRPTSIYVPEHTEDSPVRIFTPIGEVLVDHLERDDDMEEDDMVTAFRIGLGESIPFGRENYPTKEAAMKPIYDKLQEHFVITAC